MINLLIGKFKVMHSFTTFAITSIFTGNFHCNDIMSLLTTKYTLFVKSSKKITKVNPQDDIISL